jgi:hypothetical protein
MIQIANRKIFVITNRFQPFYYHPATNLSSPTNQAGFLTTASPGLLLPAQPQSIGNTVSHLTSVANTGALFDLSNAYNPHIATAQPQLNSSRASPFDTNNHLTTQTNAQPYLSINTSTNNAATLSSVLLPQHLTSMLPQFQTQIQ